MQFAVRLWGMSEASSNVFILFLDKLLCLQGTHIMKSPVSQYLCFQFLSPPPLTFCCLFVYFSVVVTNSVASDCPEAILYWGPS